MISVSVHSCARVDLSPLKEYVSSNRVFYSSELTVKNERGETMRFSLFFDKRPPLYSEGPIVATEVPETNEM